MNESIIVENDCKKPTYYNNSELILLNDEDVVETIDTNDNKNKGFRPVDKGLNVINIDSNTNENVISNGNYN